MKNQGPNCQRVFIDVNSRAQQTALTDAFGSFNHFLAIYDFCRLLPSSSAYLFGRLYCKQYGPRLGYPRGYNTIFMLNSTKHKMSTAGKTEIRTNKGVSCFKSLSCCIYHTNKC